jgi:DNA anti-recombination protein RmuC
VDDYGAQVKSLLSLIGGAIVVVGAIVGALWKIFKIQEISRRADGALYEQDGTLRVQTLKGCGEESRLCQEEVKKRLDESAASQKALAEQLEKFKDEIHITLEQMQKNNNEAFSLLAETTRHQIAAMKDEINRGINQMHRDTIEYLKK